MKSLHRLRAARESTVRAVNVFMRDVGNGLLEISHNSLALLGLAVVVALVFVAGRPELRQQTETWALGWLQERHDSRNEGAEVGDLTVVAAEPDAVARATAVHPSELTKQQAALAKWISRRYNVALEPVGRLVQEAWAIGQSVGLDPTLILAIAAIESRFNPFAQSAMGAQGLMQVMTRIHDDKYVVFGGNHAAFDPLTNLRVGVQVLKECIARAGSLEGGLRFYVGAANLAEDGGYASKVLSEQAHLRHVSAGRSVAITVPQSGVVVTPARVATEAPDAADAPLQSERAAPSAANEQLALLRQPG
jgi:Transglycosylase SLT domain